MFSEWERISTIAEIEDIKQNVSNADGETSHFELKGSTGSFDKESKKKLAKEISAMSNTYGGLVCFHAGGGDEIETFKTERLAPIEKALESWLSSATEPPILGLKSKQVEGVFLIGVPESQIKPHRAQAGKQYYFRSNSNSVPMPEIMISSLYKQGAMLVVKPNLSMSTHGNGRQLSVTITARNDSRVLGTKPMFSIDILGDCKDDGLFNERGNILEVGGFTRFMDKHPLIHNLGHFASNKEFRNELLYPEHSLFLSDTFPMLKTGGNLRSEPFKSRLFLVTLRLNFAEAPGVERCFMFQNSEASQMTKIAEGDWSEMSAEFLSRK